MARVPDARVDEATEALVEFFRVQRATVLAKARRKAKIDDIFSLERWNKVLIPELLEIARTVSLEAARRTLKTLGVDDEYDVERTLAWLREHVSGVASGVNQTTRDQLRDALKDAELEKAVQHVFEVAIAARAAQIARTEVTAASGFGTREAAQQTGSELTKTWITGSNPRQTHAAMNGETVGIEDLFSNGARWPGDSLLPADERAGCNCHLEIGAPR